MPKIIELRVNGFARLSAVTIRPDGALVQITGRNGQGKTSCLNAIWTALSGRAAAPAQPINKNAEEARLHLDLGTMVVVRTFKRGRQGDVTSDLRVTMADGSRVGTKPQAMIDALIGDLSFNPVEFAHLPAKDQFERVKALVPGFDFHANASARHGAFDDRTDANRRAKAARAQAAGVVLPPGPKPKPVDMAALSAELQQAIDKNNQRAASIQRRASRETERARLLREAEELTARAAQMVTQADEIAEEIEMVKIPDAIDTNKMHTTLANAQTVGQAIAKFEERARHEAEAATAETEASQLTASIEALDTAKHEAITKAKMPVKGLSFGDDEVLLNGLPFSQAGTAEKITASVGIAMALNPQLRVMLIDEGSELDSKSLALISGMAEKHDYQVWLARVDESGKVGFVIEDGALKETP